MNKRTYNPTTRAAADTQPGPDKSHSGQSGNGAAHDLPPIEDGTEAVNLYSQAVPSEIIKGMLHQGAKMVIGGGSKSFKTWCLMDLVLSVATGAEWWGIPTSQGRVLYLNLEIQKCFFGQRQNAISTAKAITLKRKQIDVWNLRGYCADLTELAPKIIQRARGVGYSLIVIDPIYKCMGDRDENKAGDIGALLNEIERMAVQTDAAVAFGAHFSKGNQASKESMDRISGSGVFARDPDSILTLTRHEQDDAFIVDATLRNFAPIEPFVVKWQYPLMVRDANLDPAKLKKTRTGAAAKYSVKDILDVLELKTMATAKLEKAVRDETGMSHGAFYDIFKAAKAQNKIKKTGKGWSKL